MSVNFEAPPSASSISASICLYAPLSTCVLSCPYNGLHGKNSDWFSFSVGKKCHGNYIPANDNIKKRKKNEQS